MALLITKLDGEYQNIKQQTLNILFQITTSSEWICSIILLNLKVLTIYSQDYYSHAKWQSLITEPLLSIIMQSQTGLSEPALTLLKVCLRQSKYYYL
jgi:hypothetical protein